MKELIKIEERDGVKTVDSRKLHSFLGVKDNHRDWIKRKTTELGLIDGEDYFAEKSAKKTGETRGRQAVVYYLTQRSAEHIGMAESTDKGTLIRDAFIAARDELKKAKKSALYQKSTEHRNILTSRWARHGIGHNFGRATIKEYEVAFGDKEIRKAAMDENQLLALSALECLEALKLDQSPRVQGISDIEGSLEETGRALADTFSRLRMTAPKGNRLLGVSA